MSQKTPPDWEDAMHYTAANLRYPPTPDIAGSVRQRLERSAAPHLLRIAQIVAVVMVILTGLLAVPQVRAEIRRIIEIGVITIFFDDPAVTPTEAASTRTPRPTPTPDPSVLLSVLDLPGETTLAAAQEQFGYPISLPAYPDDLGDPDRVYYLEASGDVVVIVWLDAADQPRLSLFIFQPESDVWKQGLTNVQEDRVNGVFTIWSDEPHTIEFWTDRYGFIRRQIDTTVLIWFDSPLTYRLEGAESYDEAVKILQSMP